MTGYTRQGVQMVKWWDGCSGFSARWGRVPGYGIMLARERSVSLLFAPTLNRIWHTCIWKYAFNEWSNWRFNSPDKAMGCVEFVQMILKRHTPENSLFFQQLLSPCRCACVVMNIIEFNEFYLLWRIEFRKRVFGWWRVRVDLRVFSWVVCSLDWDRPDSKILNLVAPQHWISGYKKMCQYYIAW